MGGSGLGDPEGVTIDSMAADVARLLDALELASAPVAGWSMGGFVTQQIARHDPSRVEAMILMGTDPGGSAAVRATAETWGRLTDHSGTPREQASRMIPLLFPPELVPAIDAAFGDLIAEARAALSPDALTGMEANLRFVGPETMETKIFGRLTAWQNWIFQRPNAVGPKGALTSYGTNERAEFDYGRT
jgi:benzoyl-CoA-dihydrodiol lyase